MLKFKNSAANGQELFISGDIIDNADGETLAYWMDDKDYVNAKYNWPAAVKEQLDAMDRNKPITVYINSDGGSVPAGVAIANMLQRWNAPVTTVVEGWACSIATQIFFAGAIRKMPVNAYLMIHKPSGVCNGDADDMRKAAETLDVIQKGLENIYKAAAKNATPAEIHEMVNNETWLTGEEACDMFDITPMAPVQMAAKASHASDGFKAIPKAIRNNLVKAEKNPAPSPQEEKPAKDLNKANKDYIKNVILNADKAIIKAALMTAERQK